VRMPINSGDMVVTTIAPTTHARPWIHGADVRSRLLAPAPF
jgi:hypothetical protein